MRKLLSIAATLALAGAFAVAQDQSSQPSSSNPDQSSAQSQQQTTPDQSANPSSSTSTPDQNANPSSSSTSPDQNAAGTSATSDQNANTDANGKKLPQTASPLPLLGLLGVGSLAAGVISRRKK
jgi:LPXTG-motif cell wall-anchored protein